jgi:hypothetical protein
MDPSNREVKKVIFKPCYYSLFNCIFGGIRLSLESFKNQAGNLFSGGANGKFTA